MHLTTSEAGLYIPGGTGTDTVTMKKNAQPHIPEDSSPVMTVRQAAAFLKASRSHIFHLIHCGRVPYQRMGKHFVVPREAIEQLLVHGWVRNG
jgi:excisionase family DNA binding protein